MRVGRNGENRTANEAMYPNLHFWRMQLVAKESLRLAGNLQVMKRELERLRRIRKSLKERRRN
jgi:hypothetical protein